MSMILRAAEVSAAPMCCSANSGFYLNHGRLLLAELPLEEDINIAAGINHSNLMLESVVYKADGKRAQGKLNESETGIFETMQRVEREKVSRIAAFAKLNVRRASVDYRRNKLHVAYGHAKACI